MTAMNTAKQCFRKLKRSPAYRVIALPRRAYAAAKVTFGDVPKFAKWVFSSREETNFTFDLTPVNLEYLAHILSVVGKTTPAIAKQYIDELSFDEELKGYIDLQIFNSAYKSISDRQVRYAKRIGWYALARIMKPKIIVETGIDKGLGSVVLCHALMKNSADGYPGRFIGTDINPDAGWMMKKPYSDYGEIRYGDSIETLLKMPETIDLFINDSDHSASYEAREYEAITEKLSKTAIIIGDNAHDNIKLAEYSKKRGRSFLFFKEEPYNHWYRGGGIGFSF
jgi:predicted O-methyltransferase YrrM